MASPVSHAHLLDNWTLQNAGELLHEGLLGDTTSELSFTADGSDYEYRERPADLMRLDALFQVLHHAVFADALWIDDRFVGTWQEYTALKVLQNERLLVTKPFTGVLDEWKQRREAIIDELCFCPGVRRKHDENVRQFAETGESADGFLSQLLWGGAGMLARADHFGLIYVPHPARERLFTHARFLRAPAPAQEQVQSFIQTERLKLWQHVDGSGLFARYHLPPVIVQIIEEASDIHDLPRVALQLRAEYSALRRWIQEFQLALDAEDLPEILSRRKLLEDVAQNLKTKVSSSPVGDTTVQFGLSWLKFTTKAGSPLNSLRNRFGVRSQLNRLALTAAGRKSFKKLLKLLQEDGTERALALERAFLEARL